MPENAWQESRDTGLRHLSVGVALYAGLCSGFMLAYVWRSWESTSFLVAVVIVGFVRPVCLDASDSSKTIKVV